MPPAGNARSGARHASKTRSANPPSKSATGKASGAQGRLPDGTGLDALALLETDHRTVAQLFAAFAGQSGDAAQRDIANAICVALKIHARLEEELFYPALAKAFDDPALIDEALVEHASARDLMAQIEAGSPGEALYAARVKVLGEYVQHHVAEEENELFPQCRKAGIDLAALGAVMTLRRQELALGFVVSNPVIGRANARADANA